MDFFSSMHPFHHMTCPLWNLSWVTYLSQGCPKRIGMLWMGGKITTKKIEAAISAFPPSQGPGSWRLSCGFLQILCGTAGARLSALLEHCLEHYQLPKSMLDAYKIRLLKPSKDPLECSSYRPILNMYLKILTKVLATRLAKVISCWYRPNRSHAG